MGIEELVETASRIGRATVDELFSPAGDGFSMLAPHELPADIREAVAGIEISRDPGGTERFKYKLHPKLQALDLIAKLRGLVTKKTELDVVMTGRDLLRSQRLTRIEVESDTSN